MTEPTYIVKNFLPSRCTTNRFHFIVGSRSSGKTVLTRDLIKQEKRNLIAKECYNICVHVFCGVSGKDFSGLTNNLIIHEKPSIKEIEDIVNKMLTMQKLRRIQLEKQGVDLSAVQTKASFVHYIFAFSDIYKFGDLKIVHQLAMNGRHYYCSLIIEQPHPKIPPQLRAQVDYLYLLKNNSLEHVWRNWSFHDTFKHFQAVYARSTPHHQAMVIDNTTHNTDITYTYEFGYYIEKWRIMIHTLRVKRLLEQFLLSELSVIIVKYGKSSLM